MAELPPVIVGAGPAGIRAAATLRSAGLAPIVIDEAPRCGGQIYRRAPPGFTRPYQALYGFEADKARRLHGAFDRIAATIDYRPQTLVWDLKPGVLMLLTGGKSKALRFRDLVLATGARDRVIPFPGWTTPGVYTLGGAQIALKYQGCAIGRDVVFMGTGPLLYLVAYQYAKAGARVAAVLDTTPLAAKLSALPGLVRGGATFAKGLWYVAALRARGVRIESGIRPIAVEGGEAVSGFAYRTQGGSERQIACDALAFGFGLSSETQLADLAGVTFDYEPAQRQFLPRRDFAGRTAADGIYLAGDGAGIGGADVAELTGERAALSLLQDRGIAVALPRLARIDRALRRLAHFRLALDAAFPYPSDIATEMADDTILCRCENVTAGAFRQDAHGATEINRAKAFSRCGMGRCQGRICGPAAHIVLAATAGLAPEQAGRLRGQPPVKPIPMMAAP